MNKNKRKQMKPRYVLWLIIVLCLVFIGVSLKNNGEKLNIQNGISSLVLPMEKGLNSIGQWIGERREYSRSVNDLLTEKEVYKRQLLDELAGEFERMRTYVIGDKIATMACKAAVKGNMRISSKEADALIEELLRAENPYTCLLYTSRCV